MIKHSPAPWSHGEDDPEMEVEDANGNPVISGCGCCGSPYGANTDDESKANLQLILAAPDLLDALQNLLKDVVRDHDPYGSRAKAEVAVLKATSLPA